MYNSIGPNGRNSSVNRQPVARDLFGARFEKAAITKALRADKRKATIEYRKKLAQYIVEEVVKGTENVIKLRNGKLVIRD